MTKTHSTHKLDSTERRRQFDNFFMAAYSQAKRFARSLVREAEEVEDVLQESFIKAFRSYEKTHAELPNGPSWLFQIIRNVHIDRVRARKRRIQPVTLSESFDDQSPTEPIDHRSDIERIVLGRELGPDFEKLLSSIPGDQELAIRMSLREDLSEHEMANRANCSLPTFRRKIALARRSLLQAIRTNSVGSSISFRESIA